MHECNTWNIMLFKFIGHASKILFYVLFHRNCFATTVYYLKEQFGRNIMNDFVENNFIHECYRATCLVVGYDKSFSLNIFLRDKTRMLEVGHMNYIHPYILPTCLVFCNFISFLWNALESTENKIYSSSFYLRCKKINLLLQYLFIVH